jgi:hypothetical protein
VGPANSVAHGLNREREKERASYECNRNIFSSFLPPFYSSFSVVLCSSDAELPELIPSPTISIVLILRDCAPHNPVDITLVSD